MIGPVSEHLGHLKPYIARISQTPQTQRARQAMNVLFPNHAGPSHLDAGTCPQRPAKKVSWRCCSPEGPAYRGVCRTGLVVSRGACTICGRRSSELGTAGGVAGLSSDSSEILPIDGGVPATADPTHSFHVH